MQVTEDPNLSLIFFFDLLHQIFDSTHFWMKVQIGINPLSVEIDTSQRVSIIADNDSIRIHARYEYESIESSEILGLSTVARYEVIDALKYLTAGALSRMDS